MMDSAVEIPKLFGDLPKRHLRRTRSMSVTLIFRFVHLSDARDG